MTVATVFSEASCTRPRGLAANCPVRFWVVLNFMLLIGVVFGVSSALTMFFPH